ncbi:leucine-rich PPR motif-containing protein, mitochondrial-like [Sitodiplosis mosellana]|uniref:leucine-rich PPR motif-containing protein, mitochondrial-like n=1 Tax=Sitodiplosis mosellana TaxID=263140 RepID=UPI002443EC86|nr:leucine-rich PPR motif-containing protein, mitochondrial-like [Sitodiplosis mosellana]
MYRLVLAQVRKPIDLSAFTSTFCTKVSIRRPLRENSGVEISGTLNRASNGFQHGMQQFLVKINPFLAIKPFSHTYATDATVPKSDKSESMSDIIKELNNHVANKNRISHHELKTLLSKLKTQDVTGRQALDILRFCAFGRTDQNVSETVKSIWYELKKQEHEFHTQHYNYLLRFASEKQDVIHTQAIFDEMFADGIEPDAVSYQCLLSVYCKSGNIAKAIEILDLMNQDQFLIDECSYNYVVQCHIICGNIEAANATITSLNESGFRINRDTLATFLRHYAKAGDVENVQKTLASFKTENIELMNNDILNVIYELAANGYADKIDMFFEYLQPNAELLTSLANAITLFVANKQSTILPTILQLAKEAGDVRSLYKHLINEMVRHVTAGEEFTATIKLIEANGYTVENSFDMFKSALKGSSEEIIRRLLVYMKANEMEVTQITFEKLFQFSAAKGVDEVLNVVNLMCTDFRILPQSAYIRDVILPAFGASEDTAFVLTKLRKTKIPVNRTIIALVNKSLNKCDFKTAIDLLNSLQCFYANNRFITQPLLNAYASTGDEQSFVRIVNMMHANFAKINEDRDVKLFPAIEVQKKQKFIGEMLYASIAHTLTDSKRLTQLLDAFIAERLVTSSKHIEKIQEELLKVNGSSQISRLLTKLSADKVQLKPSNRKPRIDMDQLSAAELQIILDEQRSMGRDVAGTEKLLLLAYIHGGNVAQVDSMMSGGQFTLTNANYAKLIELYTRIGNLESALDMLKQVRTKNPSFKLNPTITAQLATLMYENNVNFDEICALLYTQRLDKEVLKDNIPFEKFLQRLAADGHTQLVEQLFNTLVKFNYIKVSIQTVGPLISVHLNNAVYSEAVAKYEYLAKTYKLTPMSTRLFEELIRNNELDLLQRAFNTHEAHDKSDAIGRLALAFSQCGQARQAKSHFERVRINDVTKIIHKQCKRYVVTDDIESAKKLLKSTSGLSCDRRKIYQTILDIYHKQNMAEEALELWTDIANDNILPSANFVDKLVELLRANNIKLPSDLEMKIATNLKIDSKNT